MLLLSSDLWQEKFKNCRMENTTFLHPKEGCHLDFEVENDIIIYLVSFMSSLSALPGNILSALFMDRIGRIRIISEQQRSWSLQVCPDRFQHGFISPLPSRWFNVGVVRLHFPAAAKFQPSSCDFLAVCLLCHHRGGLERTGGHLCGTLPVLEEVQSQTSRPSSTFTLHLLTDGNHKQLFQHLDLSSSFFFLLEKTIFTL